MKRIIAFEQNIFKSLASAVGEKMQLIAAGIAEQRMSQRTPIPAGSGLLRFMWNVLKSVGQIG